jgi:hypothetical protein
MLRLPKSRIGSPKRGLFILSTSSFVFSLAKSTISSGGTSQLLQGISTRDRILRPWASLASSLPPHACPMQAMREHSSAHPQPSRLRRFRIERAYESRPESPGKIFPPEIPWPRADAAHLESNATRAVTDADLTSIERKKAIALRKSCSLIYARDISGYDRVTESLRHRKSFIPHLQFTQISKVQVLFPGIIEVRGVCEIQKRALRVSIKRNRAL